MKRAALLILAGTASLLTSGCNYVKPIMYLDVVNHSGEPLRNLEVKYPTGAFGLAELRNGQSHQRLTPKGSPCSLAISFEDGLGKKYSNSYDLGSKCPLEVAFDVAPGMQVSKHLIRP